MPKSITALLRGFLLSLGLIFICTMIGAALLYWSPLDEDLLGTIMPYVRFICIFCGAMAAASFNGHQGLWQGLGISVMFIVFFVLCRIFLQIQTFNIFTLGITFLLAGTAGGIVGVMLK